MTLVRTLAWIVLALSLFYYRSGSILKNVIIFKTPLPIGYLSGGDYTSDCHALGPGDATDRLDSLQYCEDTGFWDLRDVSGKASSRLVLFSCDPNRKSWNTVMGPLHDPNPRGALWVYTPPTNGQPEKKPQRITLKNYPEGHDFHPLGFEIWPSHGGNASNLYVINHARARTVIEQFTVRPSDPTVATHVRTLSSPYFVAPNSLALTSPDSFYVTNDHLITRRWPIIGPVVPLIESILGLPLAFVSHITLNPPSSSSSSSKNDAAIASHTFAAKFLPFPNGISLSSDGKKVAVAISTLAHIAFFDRDPATNVLTRNEQTVPVPFCPDNVRFTAAGAEKGVQDELIVAGHPHFPSLTLLAKNVTGTESGSWVVSVVPKDVKSSSGGQSSEKTFDGHAPTSASNYVSDGPTWTLKTLFQSDGSERGFRSSSTGIRDPDSGTLYVTGLYDPSGAVACHTRK